MPSCTYCGDPATDRDHIVPAAYLGHKTFESRSNLTPACRECNILLGDRYYPSVGRRAAYLTGALSRRYARVLRTPAWSEDELADLSPEMAASISQTLALSDAIRLRIKHCDHIARTND